MLLDMIWSAEGLLDDFGDAKRIASPADLRRSHADTVIVLNDKQRRCFLYGEAFELDLWVSHYGEKALERGRLRWQVSTDDAEVARGVTVWYSASGVRSHKSTVNPARCHTRDTSAGSP